VKIALSVLSCWLVFFILFFLKKKIEEKGSTYLVLSLVEEPLWSTRPKR
jgi:hypothetical protein